MKILGMNASDILFALFIGLVIIAVVVAAYYVLRRKARRAISSRIMEVTTPPAVQPAEHTLHLHHESAETPMGAPAPMEDSTVELIIVTPEEIPAPTQEVKDLQRAIVERGAAYKRFAFRVLLVLMGSTLGLGLVHWLVQPTGPSRYEPSINRIIEDSTFPTLLCVYVVLTFIALLAARFTRSLFGTASEVAKGTPKSNISGLELPAAIRPRRLVFLIWFWVWAGVSKAMWCYSTLPGNNKYLFTFGAFALSGGIYAWFRLGRRRLERIYAVPPPLHLLALRVFGSPFLSEFLLLTKAWRYMGITFRLDGPDTVGYKESDVWNYVTGRLHASIVEDQEELALEIEHFGREVDPHLRYPINSMQCLDKTWKEALDRMIGLAHVAVVDLANLTPANKGVAYEVTRLLEIMPRERVVFLINGSTDLAVVREVMSRALVGRSSGHPHAGEHGSRVVVYHTGVVKRERDLLSIFDDGDGKGAVDALALVGLLHAKALASFSPQQLEERARSVRRVRWTRLRIPMVFRILGIAALALQALFALMMVLGA